MTGKQGLAEQEVERGSIAKEHKEPFEGEELYPLILSIVIVSQKCNLLKSIEL